VVTIGLWFAATGLLCLSLESLGVATALFGIAVLLIRSRRIEPSANNTAAQA
jgi:hypothetical protein